MHRILIFPFVNCAFRNISSKKTPGCIYAISCTIEIINAHSHFAQQPEIMMILEEYFSSSIPLSPWSISQQIDAASLAQTQAIHCIDCIDFASYELWSGEKTITTYHCNFINSSKNSGHCLNIHCQGDFFYCAFAKTASSFCANSKEVKFTNCMIDKSQSIGTFTIDISPCFNFNVQKQLKCNILTHKRCRKNNTPFIYIFMINLCTK